MQYGYANESLTGDRNEAKNYLINWWGDCAEFCDYYKNTTGEYPLITELFDNPELFMVRMVGEGVNNILSYCSTVDNSWDDKLELTPDVIESIKSEVEGFEDYNGLFA